MRKVLWVVFAPLFFSACGGGGGSGDKSASVPSSVSSVSAANGSSVSSLSEGFSSLASDASSIPDISSAQNSSRQSSIISRRSSAEFTSNQSSLANQTSASSVSSRQASSITYSSFNCGAGCDDFGSDWWPDKAGDVAGVYSTPAGSFFKDFTAEHITPFGGWFSFTGVDNPEYWNDYYVCWSTSETELSTSSGLNAARQNKQCILTDGEMFNGVSDTHELKGHKSGPFILINLDPSTTYYIRAVSSKDNSRATNIVQIRTKDDPRIQLTNEHPRVALTPTYLSTLKSRYQAKDERLIYWINTMRSRLDRAINPNDSVYATGRYSVSAALVARITEEQKYIDGALYLLKTILQGEYSRSKGEFTHQGDVTGNAYRWAGADMALVSDLLWDYLSTTDKQQILDLMLSVDENSKNQSYRFEDTDLDIAITQIQISHGLTFLNTTDLTNESLTRLEKVFDKAIRRWYGLHQVKMRSTGRYGLAGGAMDDGTDYGRGTQGHWMEILWMLENAGMPQHQYGPWVWNQVRANNIYPLVPGDKGLVTIGDIEGTDPDILQEAAKGWSSDALKLCLLKRYGLTDEAAYLRDLLLATRSPEKDDQIYGNTWAFVCDDSAIGRRDRSTLPTSFHSNGYGLLFDRTSWDANAAYLFFSAGWRVVDHSHYDVGHFSLWANGKWIVHEMPQYYEGAAGYGVQAHNIFEYGNSGVGQNPYFRAGESRILKVVSNSQFLFVLADTTQAYSSREFRPDLPTKVTRSLYWEKNVNRVILYDRVEGAKDNVKRLQHICGIAKTSGGKYTSCDASSVQINQLYDQLENGRVEMLMVVNGNGNLTKTDEALGVDNSILFDRNTGDLK